jgi:hypothetical protein
VASARSALIIGGDDYSDPGLRRLRAPASDARALARVLEDPAIGGFDVRTLLNEPAHLVSLAVEEFFADRLADDLLLVHFSCHGVKDEDGELYFAMANTVLRRLAATAVPADFVNRRMNRSRSRRVVLLLDCCYAGAFERGMTARAGSEVGIESQFGGRGRAVITASSAMEYAFEGDVLADASEVAPSVFTSALVEGLETGEADRDQDGLVALDELYDYIYDRVRTATPNQTPGKWTFGVQGELVIARRARPVTVPAPLPPELLEAIGSRLATVRAAAVEELARLLAGQHAGRALAARRALEELTDDDSRTVAAAAATALDGETATALDGETATALDGETATAAATPPAIVTATPPGPADAAPPESEPAAPTIADSEPAASAIADPESPEPESTAQQTPEPEATAPPIAEPEPADPADGEPQPAPPADAEPDSAAATPPADEPAAVPDADGPLAPAAGTPAPRRDGLIAAAAVLSAASGIAVIGSLFPTFADSFRLAGTNADVVQVTITGLAALVASVLLAAPRTRRLIGPGILLGLATEAPNSAVYDVIVGHAHPPVGPGMWLNVAGGLALTAAAILAVVALARTSAVRLGSKVPAGLLPKLVVLIAAVSAIVLIVLVLREGSIPGVNSKFSGGDAFSLVWSAAMTLAVPAAAMIVLPRSFGLALLAGGLTNDVGNAAFYTTTSSSEFAILILILLVLAIVLAVRRPDRNAPAPTEPAEPA